MAQILSNADFRYESAYLPDNAEVLSRHGATESRIISLRLATRAYQGLFAIVRSRMHTRFSVMQVRLAAMTECFSARSRRKAAFMILFKILKCKLKFVIANWDWIKKIYLFGQLKLIYHFKIVLRMILNIISGYENRPKLLAAGKRPIEIKLVRSISQTRYFEI